MLRYENLSWPARVLDARGDLVVADRAAAELLGASVWALAYGQNSVAARSAAEQALAAARRHPPPSPTLEPWISALSEAIMAGDGGRALDLVAETFALDGALSYVTDIARFYEAWAHLFLGDRDASEAAARRHDAALRSGFGGYLADWTLARLEADPVDSLNRYQRAAEQASRLGAKFIVRAIDREIAHLHLGQGRPREALEILAPLCQQWYEANDVTNWVNTLCLLTPAFAGLADWASAALLLGALEERRTYALPTAGMGPAELDLLIEQGMAELGEAAFEREFRVGRRASQKELMDQLRPVISLHLAPQDSESRQL